MHGLFQRLGDQDFDSLRSNESVKLACATSPQIFSTALDQSATFLGIQAMDRIPIQVDNLCNCGRIDGDRRQL
ncbi:hypothetical protein [Prescottella soli]